MIVELHKYLVYGVSSQMDRFFAQAQKEGFIEFLGESRKKSLELPDAAKKLLHALKIAKQHFIQPHHAPQEDAEAIADQLLTLHAKRESLFEKKRWVEAEIVRVAPLGDFSKEDIEWIESEAGKFVQFYCMKSSLAEELYLPDDLIFISREYGLDYFMAVHREKKQYPKMAEIQVHVPLGGLKQELQEIIKELASSEEALLHYANGIEKIQAALADTLSEYHLELVRYDAELPLERLFAIEAWVPVNRIDALMRLLDAFGVSAEMIAIEQHDRIPTCIENRGMARVGEDLVHIYDTPASKDKDPSLWVLIFFSIFFAVIISDAGYGLIYLILGLILKWKAPKNRPFLQRFAKLALLVSSVTICWGVATVSFFGLEIGPNNPLRKISFLHYLATRKIEYHIEKQDTVYQEYLREYPEAQGALNGHDFFLKTAKTVDGLTQYPVQKSFYDNILLEISLLIGIVHLILSFLRAILSQWCGAGWILFLVGGYLFFPTYLGATSLLEYMGWVTWDQAREWGSSLLILGPALVFVLALLQKRKWGAFHELTNGIQVFSDVLSYLRLYALALSGMVMAETFNEMGMKMGILLGFIIILAGHLVNLALVLMGGVIHGLRLNFLEWYRYSFEGGGRLFHPLRKMKTLID